MFAVDQKSFISDVLGIKCDFDHMTDDEILNIDESVSDYLCTKGMGRNYEPTPEGRMCEGILDAIAAL